jgi:hypothetical protein
MALGPLEVFAKWKQYAEEEPLLAPQGFNVCEAAFEYEPRHPEENHKNLDKNLDTHCLRI